MMDRVNINLATKEQLKTLPGCGKAIASEIIKKRRSRLLTEDDIKSLMKLLAKYWQQWLDVLVTFEVPDESEAPNDEKDVSTSGNDTRDSSLDKTQDGQDDTSAQPDNNNGLKQPQQSPIKSQRGSPTGSICSRYSGTSHISSVSSTSRRQYEDRIPRLEEALAEKNQQLVTEKFMNTRQHSEIQHQRNLADNQNRREQELIDERNSQRQQIAELRTRLNDQDKRWTE